MFNIIILFIIVMDSSLISFNPLISRNNNKRLSHVSQFFVISTSVQDIPRQTIRYIDSERYPSIFPSVSFQGEERNPRHERERLVLYTVYTSNSRPTLNIIHPLFIRDHGWNLSKSYSRVDVARNVRFRFKYP